MAEWLTPRTLDQEVRVSSLARPVFPLELYSTLCLFTQVYKWVSATYCGGGGEFNPAMDYHPVQGGSSNTSRHASCYGNRYKLRQFGPWFKYAFTFPFLLLLF